MDEFASQLQRNLSADVQTLNDSQALEPVRVLYKENYDLIKGYISKSNPKSAVEDIANLNKDLSGLIHENRLLLKEINKAIIKGELPLDKIR